MTYQECLEYMYAKLPMYQRVGQAAYKKDLTNIRVLCEHLGNPQEKLKCVHIAGTNGKGSITHILGSAFMQAGFKTGMYTSPHYLDFRERIKINGKCISEGEVISFIESVKDIIEEIQPSFFEITNAMAFHHFVQQGCAYCIIETGLGGRLDSTNIIVPLLSVISNISYDHMALLGNTLAEIAYEKAGIIKPGIPVVIGESSKEYDHVFFKKSEACNSEILFADGLYDLVSEAEAEYSEFIYKDVCTDELISVQSDLGGPFQALNIRTSLVAFECLQDKIPGLEMTHFMEGLLAVRRNTQFIGRWMKFTSKPCVLVDSAHNEGGIRALVARVETLPFDKIHWVLGMVSDKDHHQVLAILPKEALYYFCRPSVDRGFEAESLWTLAAESGLSGNAYDSVANAFEQAKINASENDLVLVAGSVFLVADVLPLL